jgi:hypothetical protein
MQELESTNRSTSNSNEANPVPQEKQRSFNSTLGSAQPPSDSNPAVRRVPPKLYRIGEVIDYSGLSRQTIHNYTTMGLIRESNWTRGGHRLYGENVFERLDKIADFKARRKSLGFIREYFSGLDQATDG